MKTRDKINKLYEQKEEIDAQIEEIRGSCEHKNKSEVDYMWRVGSIDKALVCDDCDEFIRYVEDYTISFELTEDQQEALYSEPAWIDPDVKLVNTDSLLKNQKKNVFKRMWNRLTKSKSN